MPLKFSVWPNPGLWYCSLVGHVKNEIRILRGAFPGFVVPVRFLVFVFNYFTMPLKSGDNLSSLLMLWKV